MWNENKSYYGTNKSCLESFQCILAFPAHQTTLIKKFSGHLESMQVYQDWQHPQLFDPRSLKDILERLN